MAGETHKCDPGVLMLVQTEFLCNKVLKRKYPPICWDPNPGSPRFKYHTHCLSCKCFSLIAVFPHHPHVYLDCTHISLPALNWTASGKLPHFSDQVSGLLSPFGINLLCHFLILSFVRERGCWSRVGPPNLTLCTK